MQQKKKHNQSSSNKDIDKEATAKVVVSLVAYRRMAMQDPMVASKKIMTSSAYAMWKKQVDQLDKKMQKMCLIDFFNTAVVLAAPQKTVSGISALYSPFLDVILLVQTDNIDSVAKIEKFCFLPGDIFRGESISWKKLPESIFPSKYPFSIAIMQVFSNTEKCFNDFARNGFSFNKYSKNSNLNTKYVFRNMIIRAQCALKLTEEKHKSSYNKMLSLLRNLQYGTQQQLSQNVAAGISQEQVNQFFLLQANIRTGLKLTHALISLERDLYVFTNKDVPRFIVVISADKKQGSEKLYFEWFDLNMSQKMLSKYFK